MGSGFKDWAAGDVLTAADVDGYLMRQTVMTFADASARDTALSGVLDEGMVAYLEDTNVTTYYDGSSWEDIRGLGGGSATSPGGFSSGDVLDAADLNALPGGMVGNATNSSPARLTATAQTYATVTFTAVSGRMYRAIGQLYATGPDAAGELVGWLVCDGTRRGQSATYFDTTDNEAGISCIAIFTGSGSFTVNFQALGGDGVTDAFVENFQGIDPFLVVEDIGPT